MHELETFHQTISTAVYFIENKNLKRIILAVILCLHYIQHNLTLIQFHCNAKFEFKVKKHFESNAGH
jgi:hypothetical protein